MVSRYRGRAGNTERRPSEPRDFSLMILSGSQWILTRHGQIWRPPTDVYETDDSIVVKVEVAGMVEDDFAITFAEHALTVAGVRRDPSAKLGYHQMEIAYGEFRTDAYIPEAVDVDRIEASYKDGFLLVILPKSQFRHPANHPGDSQCRR